MHRFVPWSLVLVGGLGTLSEEVMNRCIDYHGRAVDNGQRFTPQGSDLCMQCSCIDNRSVMCLSVLCSPPKDCKSYETLKDKCCEFLCLDRDFSSGINRTDFAMPDLDSVNTTNLGLRLVASTLTSLLILALLLFMVHRLRQRRLLLTIRRLQNARINSGGPRLSRRLSMEDENVIGYFGACEELDFPLEEPPPPYTFYKLPDGINSLPRGEPPPPYEASVGPHNFIRPDPICYSPTSDSSFTTSIQGSPVHSTINRHHMNIPSTIFPDGNSDSDSSSRSSQSSDHHDDSSTFDSRSDSSGQSFQYSEGTVIQSDARYEDLVTASLHRGKASLPSILNYSINEASGCTIPKKLITNPNLAKKFNRYSYGDYTNYLKNGRELEILQRRSLQELGATERVPKPASSATQAGGECGSKPGTTSANVDTKIFSHHEQMLKNTLPKDFSKRVSNLVLPDNEKNILKASNNIGTIFSNDIPRAATSNKVKKKVINVENSSQTIHSTLLQGSSKTSDALSSSSCKNVEELCSPCENQSPATCVGIAGIRKLHLKIVNGHLEPLQTSIKPNHRIKIDDLNKRCRPRSCNDVGVQADTRKKRRSKDLEGKSGKCLTKSLAANHLNKYESATNPDFAKHEKLQKCRDSNVHFGKNQKEDFEIHENNVASRNYILEDSERNNLQLVRSSSICSETGELRRPRLCVSPIFQPHENAESAILGAEELCSSLGEILVLKEINKIDTDRAKSHKTEKESDV